MTIEPLIIAAGIQSAVNLVLKALSEFLEGKRIKERYNNRLKEIKEKALLDLEAQRIGHEYRKAEIIVSSRQNFGRDLIIREVAHKQALAQMEHKAHLDDQAQRRGYEYRIKETLLSAELNLRRDLMTRKVVHEQAKELQQLRHELAIQEKRITRYLEESEENSPFPKPTLETIEFLKEGYRANKKPLVLIAPFWDDTRSKKANDEGGFLDYRVAISVEVAKLDNITALDGYFKRPLRHEDLDIAKIFSALPGVPIILIHGKIEGKRKVHPSITICNLIPEQKGRYFRLKLDFFDVKKFHQDNPKIEFQPFIAHYLATIVKFLSEAYAEFQSERKKVLFNRLESEAESISQLGFDIFVEIMDEGYVLELLNEDKMNLLLFISSQYPHDPPEVFIEEGGSEMVRVDFEPGVWRPDRTLREIVSVVITG